MPQSLRSLHLILLLLAAALAPVAFGQGQTVVRGSLVTDVTSWLPPSLRDSTSPIGDFQSSPKGDLLLLMNGETLYTKAADAPGFTRLIGKGDTSVNGSILSLRRVSVGPASAYFEAVGTTKDANGSDKVAHYVTDWIAARLFLNSTGNKIGVTCGSQSLSAERSVDFIVNAVRARVAGQGAIVTLSTLSCPSIWFMVDPSGSTARNIPIAMNAGERPTSFYPRGELYDDEPFEDQSGRIVYATVSSPSTGEIAGRNRVYRLSPASGDVELLADNYDRGKTLPGPYTYASSITLRPQRATGTMLVPVGLFYQTFATNLLRLRGSTFTEIFPGTNLTTVSSSADLSVGFGSDRFVSVAAGNSLSTWTPNEGLQASWNVRSDQLPNWPKDTNVFRIQFTVAADKFTTYVIASAAQGISISRMYRFNRVVLDSSTQVERTITLNGGGFNLGPSIEVLQNGAVLDPSSYSTAGDNIRIPMPIVAPYGDYTFAVRVNHPVGILTSNELQVKFEPSPALLSAVAPATGTQTPLAPGMLVAITGTNLCGSRVSDLASASVATPNQPWPTSLGGCSVLVNGSPIPIRLSATLPDLSSRIEAQLPFSLSDPARITVQRFKNDGALDTTSAPFIASVASAAPSLFVDASGNAVIENLSTSAVASAETPIAPGDTIRIRGVGFGATNPPSAAGTPSPDGTPAVIAAPVRAWLKIRVNGDWAFAELAITEASYDPSHPGMAQFVATVPSDLPFEAANAFLVMQCGGIYTDEYPTVIGVL